MEPSDLEAAAESVFRLAGQAVGRCSPVRLANCLGINVVSVPNLRQAGCLAMVGHVPTIAFRASLDAPRRAHVVGHELGHWVLSREGVRDSQWTEDWCDYIGGALVAPRPAIRRAFAAFGTAFSPIAASFRTTETLVALRMGEVTSQSVAVVAPQRVRARGDAVWPAEDTVRAWARRPGPGISSVRLQDDRKRVVLMAI